MKVGDASTSATNTGAISAAAVELRAQQGNVYALAGNTGGVINATGVDASGGTIKLISERRDHRRRRHALGARPERRRRPDRDLGRDARHRRGAASTPTAAPGCSIPTNLIVNATAASAIDTALASGNVTLATSASGAPTGPAGSTGDTASARRHHRRVRRSPGRPARR